MLHLHWASSDLAPCYVNEAHITCMYFSLLPFVADYNIYYDSRTLNAAISTMFEQIIKS